ncbi:monosaccharide ABC transporter membrane protein, CUT2 family [Roseovarius nanhaiticus]|uniref:Autoinducer 2 import system permease protein LsrD n=1 Tax=Roseovarius nanhaiticus TaxID=573024 RepID=A0A1N7H0L8_9RHOB|nr:ABC transporter permease [Roseovarius nanhaiticus]SEL17468.1 monosaccharide ABC transporter membrane protein, CUT2 family [Roseovarius nanhaiticus]SIS18310.1 monosaccharide ABC transporter membrane protein, CUT2 family [Roseovarius nanhaiticus]
MSMTDDDGPKDNVLKRIFIRVGVLPFFLGIALIVFTILSDKFLTVQNLVNVGRQSVYLILVSLGQMLVLISGGFDLSVGTVIALSSVVSAMTMAAMAPMFPEAVWIAIAIGALAGFGAALIVGGINGIGVAVFEVSPFIMTLGVSSVGAGLALFLTGGIPVSGLPFAFGNVFGFGRLWGVPVPVIVAAICVVLMWVFMARTRAGAQIYAVGGNIKAAHLSAINTKRTLMTAYILCSLIAALTGLLLTARVESGEANLGGTIALESIAACVIAGVSLRGGLGRVENVVLGGFFIILVQNGMNLAQVSSYMQMVLLGALLILAVIFDQLRFRMIMSGR